MKKLFNTIFMLFLGFVQLFSQNTNYLQSDSLDILSLSIEELLQIKIVGSVVRDLSLNNNIITDNLVEAKNFESPASVEIITNKTIEARGLKNVIEATDNTPGVISGISPAEPYGFSMRGFTRYNIKVLHDGISLGISTLNTRPLGTNNVNSIEIIKGPATLSYGNGSAGGTINIISKHPEITNHHIRKFNIGYGSFNSAVLNAELTGPVSKKVAYRFDVGRTSSSGWVDNTKSEIWSLNTNLLWQPNSKFKGMFQLNYANDKLPGYFGTPLIPKAEAKKPLGVISANNLVIDGSLRNYNYNVSDYKIGSDSYIIMQDFNWKMNNHISSEMKLYFAKANREWKNSESYNYDSESSKIIRDRLSVDHDLEVWGINYNLKLKNEFFGLKNSSGVRLEYSQNNFSRNVGFLNATIDSVSLVNPEAGYFGTVGTRFDYFNEKNIATVLDNKLKLTTKLSLQTIVRLEAVNVDRNRFDFEGNPRPNQSINKSIYQFNYKVGFVYEFTKDIMTYAHYCFNHGPLAGDISSISLSNASTFSPSELMQTEFGLKSVLFNNNLELTIALYDIKRRIELQFDGNNFSENEQVSRGFEIAGKNTISKKIRLGGSIAYTHAHFNNYYDADFDRVVTGNKPVNVPDLIASLWVSYNKIANLPIEVGAGSRYISERYANTLNDVTLSAYSLVNIFAAYNLKNYRLTFHVRNITNTDYIPWSDVFYTNQFILGTPRTFEINLAGSF